MTMCATMDHAQKSVLMLSNVRDRSIKLLELPAFSERGVLPDVSFLFGGAAGGSCHTAGCVRALQWPHTSQSASRKAGGHALRAVTSSP